MEIKRDFYLKKLISRRNNGLIKVITGIRRCGVSSQVKYRNFRQKMQSFSASIFSCNRPVVC